MHHISSLLVIDYLFSPGSTVGKCTVEESIGHIAEALNKAHKATSSVVTVVENMVLLYSIIALINSEYPIQAGAGSVLGCTFEQLAQIIAGVEDKKRIGICLDTCMWYPTYVLYELIHPSRSFICIGTVTSK